MIGSLLLVIAFAHRWVKRLPITTTLVYLLVGLAFSPIALDLLSVNLLTDGRWLYRVAEVAVLISLFGVGMKLRLPMRDRALRPAAGLATLSMVITVGLVAVSGVYLLGLSWGAAFLLGGALAPTDPVLASDVQLRHPTDRDRIRLTLSAEAGLNDGTAFPFVMLGLGLLGLHDIGDNGLRWLLVDVLWACGCGVGVGAALGYGVGRLMISLQQDGDGSVSFGEYLVVGLIGVSYGAALELHAYGFLSVFSSAVALRAVERKASANRQVRNEVKEDGAKLSTTGYPAGAPAQAAGTLLKTNEQLEHMLEVALVLFVGAAVATAGVRLEALWFAAVLFLVIRPLAVAPVLALSGYSSFDAGAIAWFGIRGIGSLYYLLYALERGLPEELGQQLVSLTLSIIALSILVHGISVTPLLERRKRQTN